jgi:hypothetical protein
MVSNAKAVSNKCNTSDRDERFFTKKKTWYNSNNNDNNNNQAIVLELIIMYPMQK